MFKPSHLLYTTAVIAMLSSQPSQSQDPSEQRHAHPETDQTSNTTRHMTPSQNDSTEATPSSDTQIPASESQSTPPHNLTGERFTTIAHRGASGYAPEHTFPSYDMALNDLGASYLELDLQMTKDGHLVAMHDETVDRTTNGTGRVSQYTLSELKRLDAGTKFNAAHPDLAKQSYTHADVPTLDEILSRYGTQTNYYIETKSPNVYPGMEEKLLKTLRNHHMLNSNSLEHGHVMIQSFSRDSLQKVHALNPDIPLVQLLNKGALSTMNEDNMKEMHRYATGVGPEYSDVTSANVRLLKKAGLLVHPYTVNEKSDMQRLNQYGVDGVFTNYADLYNDISGKS